MQPETAQRADLWIWHARFLRQRADVATLIRKGRVRINGVKITSPGHRVRTGMVLTLALPARTVVVEILSFAQRRGSADDAVQLFRNLDQGA